MNGVRLWQQFGPTASKEYAAVIYRNYNKGISVRRNWIQGPDPSANSLALEGRNLPTASARAPMAIPPSIATLPAQYSVHSGRPLGNKDPSQSSSGKGDIRSPRKRPPPILQKRPPQPSFVQMEPAAPPVFLLGSSRKE